ncbi:hypothetical protein EDB82DRAFT_573172 [Fusarium venenatum]|uniref:uncharacterized protein n=1 Tax=Fusarium venenatum TaxID=56646 RepID=UPI001D9DB16F|nr:hypothetical protein EDB82DRAFT_573172 [Fusarium venenatum]
MGFWKKFSSRTAQGGSVNQGSPSTTSGPTTHPQGLEVVSEGSNPVIDIVVIHGLNGHREKTWTAENGIHWLRDLLRFDIPEARILSWGYDANTHTSSSNTSYSFLYDHARTLVSDLNRRRKVTDSSERPIIFIAHSLGGIVVKSALIHSDAARKGALLDQRSIKLSTYGIVFMGTPHQGGNGVQLGRILINAASVFVQADDRLLKHLERDSEWLLQQLGQYGPISGEFVTKFAYEEYETPIALGKKILVVPRALAVVPGQADAEPIAVHANHKNMVKFKSREDVGYNTILENLQIMMKDAEAVIRARWEAERRAENARVNEKNFSLEFSLSEVNDVNHFVARNEELAQLQKILTNSQDRRIVAIHALGGMGKTQLAVAFAKQNHKSFSAVFWMNATDKETLKQSFMRAANRILRERSPLPYVERAVVNNDMEEVTKAVGRWLSERGNNEWLIIFDNYDHPSLGNNIGSRNSQDDNNIVSKDYDLRPFFPETHHGAIIITTRSSTVKLGESIRLKKLQCIGDGLKILESTSRRKRLEKDPTAIRLAEKLDGLPLALATAGAYLDQVTISFTEYLELYNESWGRLQESSPQLLSYEDRAMYSTWNISYENVEKRNKSSAMLLKLWAYFDHDDLWYDLLCGAGESAPPWLEVLTDKLAFVESMRLLCDHGLVEANTIIDMVRIAATCVASLVPTESDKEYWLTERRLLRHADRVFERTTEGTGMPHLDTWIYSEFGSLFRHQDRLKGGEVIYKRLLQEYEKTLGPNHKWTLGTVHNLGLLYLKQGRFQQAETMHKQALQGFDETLGPEHIYTVTAIEGLGNIYVDQVNQLGGLYIRQGRLNEAEIMCQRALQGKEKAFGPYHQSMVNTLYNLGLIYMQQGRLDEAETMCKRALEGDERTVGSTSFKTYLPALKTLETLGDVYRRMHKLDLAEKCYLQACSGRMIVLGANNDKTKRIQSRLEDLRLRH